MKPLSANSNDNELASSIHLEYIQNIAGYQDDSGDDDVEAYHRALFWNHYGPELEQSKQQQRIQQDRLDYLGERLGRARAALTGSERHVPVENDGQPDTKPSQPWNGWDIGMFIAALIGALSLLTFGVLNVSFNLLESGIVTFVDNPARAYFWAALLPVGALAVKIGWDVIGDPRLRKVYLWGCQILGMLGVSAWLVAYGSVYPTLSQTTAEQIATLSVFTDMSQSSEYALGGAKMIDFLIVVSQAVAEIFLSAALGIYMTILYARHRPVRLAETPGFGQRDADREALETQMAQARLALAEASGRENKLQNQLSVFLAYAKALYRKEVALREDESYRKRALLDKVTEQFRAQLEAIGEKPSRAQTLSLSKD